MIDIYSPIIILILQLTALGRTVFQHTMDRPLTTQAFNTETHIQLEDPNSPSSIVHQSQAQPQHAKRQSQHHQLKNDSTDPLLSAALKSTLSSAGRRELARKRELETEC